MKRLLHLFALAGLAAPAAAMPLLAPMPPVERADFFPLLDCVRQADSKKLYGEVLHADRATFYFHSKRISGFSGVEVTVPRDVERPVMVRARSSMWLGVDERLAGEVKDCTSAQVVVDRGRRSLTLDTERRYMPSAALALQYQAQTATTANR